MRFRKAIALLFAFAMVAAACGDDDTPATPETVVVTSIVEVPGETVTVEVPGETVTSIVEVLVTEPPPPVDPKADWPQTLVFGFVPSQEVEELKDDVDAFAAVLSEALGIRVVGVVTTDYTGLGVANGHRSGRSRRLRPCWLRACFTCLREPRTARAIGAFR